jgi:hypothetical protein
MTLACVAVAELLGRPLVVVKFVGSQDDTTVLVDEGLSGRERRGQGSIALVHHVVGLSPLSGASPFAIAGQSAYRTGAQQRRLQVLLEERKCLPCIGFACTGSPTSFLKGLNVFVTLLAPLLGDGGLCLRRASLGIDEDPALRNPTVGRQQLVIAIAVYERCQGGG